MGLGDEQDPGETGQGIGEHLTIVMDYVSAYVFQGGVEQVYSVYIQVEGPLTSGQDGLVVAAELIDLLESQNQFLLVQQLPLFPLPDLSPVQLDYAALETGQLFLESEIVVGLSPAYGPELVGGGEGEPTGPVESDESV